MRVQHNVKIGISGTSQNSSEWFDSGQITCFLNLLPLVYDGDYISPYPIMVR